MLQYWLESYRSSTVLPACHLNCWYFNLIKGSEFFFLLFWLSCLLVLSHSLVLNKCRTYIYRICNLQDCLSDLSNTLIEHLLPFQFWISFKLTVLDISLLNEQRETDSGYGKYCGRRNNFTSLFDTCGIMCRQNSHAQFILLCILSLIKTQLRLLGFISLMGWRDVSALGSWHILFVHNRL